jgi:thiol-disulfide isomerase/thioredoxin
MLRKLSTLQWLAVLLALSSLCAASVSATKGAEEEATEEPTEPEGFGWDAVKELTTETFDAAASAQDLSAVFFYAPWCGHCKNSKPAYEEAAAILAEEGIPLFAVDATEDKLFLSA